MTEPQSVGISDRHTLDAMKLALDALEHEAQVGNDDAYRVEREALRAAIEQAQEPVAWVGPSWLNPETRTWESESFAPRPINGWIPLYTAPRQWQGLTDAERGITAAETWGSVLIAPQSYQAFARAIEAKLKEKNT